MASKLVWRVSSVATGPYRSFQRRSWPTAEYRTGEPAAQIFCDGEYDPRYVKTGAHGELTVWVANHAAKPVWEWRALKRKFKTLKEAKNAAINFLTQQPHFMPVTEQNITSVTLTAPTDAL